MSDKITFIGTSHIDPDGYNRLTRILYSLCPEIILVEVSPMSLFLRKTYGRLLKIVLRRNVKVMGLGITPEIMNVINYLDLPYEYRAVRDYCSFSGSQYILADVSFYSIVRFIHAYKLVSKKNLAVLAGVGDDRFRQEKAAARDIFSGRDSKLQEMILRRFINDPLAVKREKILVKRLNKYVKKYRGKNIAYTGGWEHLIDDRHHMLLYGAFGSDKTKHILV